MPTTTNKRQRTCIACGATQQKGQLLRVVRVKDGGVQFDASGRVAGRGAYVCSPACLDTARKARKLERALRCAVTEEDYERVRREMTLAEAPGKIEE